MKTIKRMSLLLFTLILAACSGGEHGPDKGVAIGNGYNEHYLRMAADLSDAVSLTSNIPADEKKEKRKLLKINSQNEIGEVLNGAHELIHWKMTPTHIIARVKIKEGDSPEEECSLIAIPKVKGKAKVLCLNRGEMQCSSYNKHHSAFDVRGSEVYFAYYNMVNRGGYSEQNCSAQAVKGDQQANISELRYWDGKSEKVKTLFHSEPQAMAYSQLMVKDVFASETNGNVCVDMENAKPRLFCRREEGEGEWRGIKTSENHSSMIPFMKLGNRLLVEASSEQINDGTSISLEDVTDQKKRTGRLPKVVDYVLANGGRMGHGQHNADIYIVHPDGNSTVIAKSDYPDLRPARLGDWMWYYGRTTLFRIDLRDGSLDPKEYFDNTNLLSIASVSWALGDFLRVGGQGRSGTPMTSFLNANGNLVYSDKPAIPMEHPIALQWDM